jgi:hypothetical protein
MRFDQGVMSMLPGALRFKSTGPCIMDERKDTCRTVRCDQVEVRHATADQRMHLAEVVTNTQSGHLGSYPFARLFHAKEFQYGFTQGFGAVIGTLQRDLNCPVASGSIWLTLLRKSPHGFATSSAEYRPFRSTCKPLVILGQG